MSTAHSKACRDRYRVKGLCTRCGQAPVPDREQRCPTCQVRARGNGKRLREERLSKGLCYRCGCDGAGKTKCESCRTQLRQQKDERRQRSSVLGSSART